MQKLNVCKCQKQQLRALALGSSLKELGQVSGVEITEHTVKEVIPALHSGPDEVMAFTPNEDCQVSDPCTSLCPLHSY